MTRMPISGRLMANGGRIKVDSTAVNIERFASMIKSAVHFDTQVASELYWLGRQNDYSIDSDFGPIRLPYPTVWMEWRVPNRVMIDGEMVDFYGTYVGCLLWERPLEGGCFEINMASLFAEIDSHRAPGMMPMTTQLQVDAEGRTIKGSLRRLYDKNLDAATARQMQTALGGHENVAFLALNLINCKNVTTRAAGTVNVRRSGSSKRRKEPHIEYHTIVLPGTDTEVERGPKRSGEPQGDVMPIHRVRGHFKTFTADAPLLGKFTGTYWWGWQVRGNKKNGMVITDYQVATR